MVIDMNWLDIFILIYIIYNIVKGYNLGLLLSLFNFFQIIISLVITKNYYKLVYDFIMENDFLLNIFEKVIYSLLKLIFWNKNKIDSSFLTDLLNTSIKELIIIGFSIFFVYKISVIVIDILYSLISFILEIKIIRKLNKFGGILFGLFTGIFILIIINEIFRPILMILPDTVIAKVFLDSTILRILYDIIVF